jgi:outer membrane protein TolC
MSRLLIFISILIAGILAGCASPAFREEAPREPTGHNTVSVPGVPLPAWGKAVGNEKLDKWISIGMTTSPALRAAERALKVEAARVNAARAGRKPELTVEGDLRVGSTENEMTDGETQDVEAFAGRASAAWDLDLFGKVRAEVGAASFAELSTSHMLRDQEVAFAASVADTYSVGRLWNERLRIRTEALKAHEVLIGYVSARVKAGLALPADLEALEEPRQQARQKQIAAEQELAELEAKWRYLVPKERAPAVAELGSISPKKPVAPPLESDLHAYAVNRPDVQAAHALWQETALRGKASARDRLPTVAAVAMAESEGPSPADDPEEWTAWAGARLTLPLLSPGRKAASEIGQRKSRLQEALFEDTTALAIRDLQRAYARRTHAERKWDSATVSAKNLKARFESAHRQHAQGRIPVADLEISRLAWLDAAEKEVTSYSELLRSHIDLVRACGGPQ